MNPSLAICILFIGILCGIITSYKLRTGCSWKEAWNAMIEVIMWLARGGK